MAQHCVPSKSVDLSRAPAVLVKPKDMRLEHSEESDSMAIYHGIITGQPWWYHGMIFCWLRCKLGFHGDLSIGTWDNFMGVTIWSLITLRMPLVMVKFIILVRRVNHRSINWPWRISRHGRALCGNDCKRSITTIATGGYDWYERWKQLWNSTNGGERSNLNLLGFTRS